MRHCGLGEEIEGLRRKKALWKGLDFGQLHNLGSHAGDPGNLDGVQ
jgi:hypothetical protein